MTADYLAEVSKKLASTPFVWHHRVGQSNLRVRIVQPPVDPPMRFPFDVGVAVEDKPWDYFHYTSWFSNADDSVWVHRIKNIPVVLKEIALSLPTKLPLDQSLADDICASGYGFTVPAAVVKNLKEIDLRIKAFVQRHEKGWLNEISLVTKTESLVLANDFALASEWPTHLVLKGLVVDRWRQMFEIWTNGLRWLLADMVF